jgi:uncharacterized protein (TIGR03000 family)
MGGMGGMSFGPPIVLPPGYSLVKDQDKESKENSKEHKEINRHLDEIKGTLERDIKGTLDKMSESLKQAEKRIEATEKSGLATENDVKWLKDEVKQRLLLHDMEKNLDHRIKPLEMELKELRKSLETHDEAQRRQHHELAKPGTAPKSDDSFKALESKIDTLQGSIMVNTEKLLGRIEALEKLFDDQKALHQKLEERLKNLENKAAPKETKEIELPKDKDAPKEKDAAGATKIRVAQISLSQEGIPANKALIVVMLPADARLFLNNQLTRTQGMQRTFVTPELDPTGTFTYSLRMEVMQNGSLRTQVQNVTFQPGRRVNVLFGPGSEVRVASGQK